MGIYGNWQRHPEGGRPGWDASFAQIDEPIEDQWQTPWKPSLAALSTAWQPMATIRQLSQTCQWSFEMLQRETLASCSWISLITSGWASIWERVKWTKYRCFAQSMADFELFKNIGKTPKCSVPVLSAQKPRFPTGFSHFWPIALAFLPIHACPCLQVLPLGKSSSRALPWPPKTFQRVVE